jgi:hypothetical protein
VSLGSPDRAGSERHATSAARVLHPVVRQRDPLRDRPIDGIDTNERVGVAGNPDAVAGHRDVAREPDRDRALQPHRGRIDLEQLPRVFELPQRPEAESHPAGAGSRGHLAQRIP